MMFDWDPKKSLANREKHGIDFETAKSLWLDEKRVEIEMAFPDEGRWALIAKIQERTGRQSIRYVVSPYGSFR